MATKSADGRKQYNVALVGAAGVVGQEFINVLLERRFPTASLKLLATSRSAGKRMMVGEQELVVEETTHKSFEGADLVFVSASGAASREYCPMVARMGGLAIDDSSAWRMDPAVPLVVPEINADDVGWHKGILAIPNSRPGAPGRSASTYPGPDRPPPLRRRPASRVGTHRDPPAPAGWP